MKFRFVLILLALFSINGFAQISDPSVNIGLVYTNPPLVSPGYTTVAPANGTTAFLLDNCGKINKQWSFSNSFNEACAYITPNGNCAILVSNSGSGGGAVYGNSCFEVKTWEDDLVWNYCPTGEYVGLHNDLVPLPNGNYLGVVQKTHSIADALENGFNIDNIGQNNSYKSESIVEFQPVGLNDAEIVWEWNIWDHLIQDHDSTRLNYGVIADHPEKYDVNVEISSPATGASFTHVNSVEYDEENDFILVSMFSIHEIFIIDHSTTMAESASETGGNFGKGGDLLYRWGNPQNYDRGGPNDRQIFGQHDARWIPTGFVNEGKISIYNNDGGDESELVIIDPSRDVDGQFLMDPVTGTFLPEVPFYTWRDNIWNYPPPSTLFTSGVAPLQNGSLLMHDAGQGLIAEVTQDDEVVWVYQIPGNDTNQGSGSASSSFKVRKYLPEYSGFDGQVLSAMGLIESDNVVSENCSDINDLEGENNAVIFSLELNQSDLACSNMISPTITIFNGGANDITEMEIEYSINGANPSVYNWTGLVVQGETTNIDLNNLSFTQIEENGLTISVISVNAMPDDVPTNNQTSATWNSSLNSTIGEYVFEIQSDNYGNEISLNVYDEGGAVVYSNGNFGDNITETDNFNIANTGCYEIEAIDDFGDGINSGFMRILRPDGTILFQTPTSEYSLITEKFLATDTVQPAPAASFIAMSLEPGLTTSVEFTNNSTDATSFEWTFGDGTTSTEENPINEYTESGEYEVCLIATNDVGSDTLCQNVMVEVLVSVEYEILNAIQIFPNPVKSTITLNGNTTSIDNYSITDAAGKIIETSNYKTNQINVSALPKGVYILQLADEKQRIKHHRFVKM